MESQSNMKALFIVLNAGYSEEVIETARAVGIGGATIIHARGAGAYRSFMGITVDSEKEIIFSIIDGSLSHKLMLAIKEKHGITTPAHSICFLMPVEKVVGITVSAANETGKKLT